MYETLPSSNVSRRTALVVEDEPSLRARTRQMLERMGYIVIDAGDGEGAIVASTTHDGVIDLLLTNVVMPTMQGTELADVVRAQHPGITVVYMSGYARTAFVDPGARPAAFIEKPFGEEELLEVLELHLPG
jgi:two-component system, cell cycle sensor histidine kinase and response regulator CckA